MVLTDAELDGLIYRKIGAKAHSLNCEDEALLPL